MRSAAERGHHLRFGIVAPPMWMGRVRRRPGTESSAGVARFWSMATSRALTAGGLCDITTIGAKSGRPHSIEIAFHRLDGEYFITGKPGFKRDWLANLNAHPEFTLHLRDGSDLTVLARETTDPAERDRVLYEIRTRSWGVDPEKARATNDLWVESSPLVRFTVEG
ncbi:MAG: nitroreductase/quinone reductase family protein [Actinomycetota bacterium]|nr:nitroreductase/quinone reductase family protein [Actinomycetota bacterium]